MGARDGTAATGTYGESLSYRHIDTLPVRTVANNHVLLIWAYPALQFPPSKLSVLT